MNNETKLSCKVIGVEKGHSRQSYLKNIFECLVIATIGLMLLFGSSISLAQITTLASNRPQPERMWVANGEIFWVEQARFVKAMPITGGEIRAVTTFPVAAMPTDLQVAGDEVYWSVSYGFGSGFVAKAPTAGGLPIGLAQANQPWAIAVDDSFVYWTEANGGPDNTQGLRKVPRAGGATTDVYLAGAPLSMQLVGTNIYMHHCTIGGSPTVCRIARIDRDGGQFTSLAITQGGASDLAIDSTHVYWNESVAGTINRVPLAGGQVETLATGAFEPWRLAVFGGFVYWMEVGSFLPGGSALNGAIKKVPINGGAVTTIASGLNNPSDIFVDATGIYWSEKGTDTVGVSDGAIKKKGNQSAITVTNPYYFREFRAANDTGRASGDRLVYGASAVPNGDAGTTATRAFGTRTAVPMNFSPRTTDPNAFSGTAGYTLDRAQLPVNLAFANGTDSTSVTVDPVGDVGQMPLAQNITKSGTGTALTFNWTNPAIPAGLTLDRVQISVYDLENFNAAGIANVIHSMFLPPTATSYPLPQTLLQMDHKYAISVRLQHLRPVVDPPVSGPSARLSSSQAFFNFTPGETPLPKVVAFFPGFGGTRLYQPNAIGNEDRLWIPNVFANDVCKFKPDQDGSGPSAVYAKDMIPRAGGVFDVYAGFAAFMTSLATSGDILEWKAFPYDWRKDVRAIAKSWIVKGGNGADRDLLAEFEDLLTRGRLTIITHSNGGLLAKALIQRMQDDRKTELIQKIDRVIMVAAPQLGTPQTILGVLHGVLESETLNYYVKPWFVREALETMRGAYNLLPSRSYFAAVKSSVIIDMRTDPNRHIAEYGGNSTTGFTGFLLGDGVRRELFAGECNEATEDNQPNVLHGDLLLGQEGAEGFHALFDGWAWFQDTNIRVTQVVGWGLPTASGVVLRKDCERLPCTTGVYKILAQDGDGTVLVPSARALGETNGEWLRTYYFDLYKYNATENENQREHMNIMAAQPIQGLIADLLAGDGTSSPNYADFVSPVEPDYDTGYLRLVLKSPVEVHAYDGQMRHTGLVPNLDPESTLETKEARIPNSAFSYIGNHANLTLDSRKPYQIELRGRALGTFTLELEEFVGDRLVEARAFFNLPVSETTRARFTLQHVADTKVLAIDVDGDGATDIYAPAGTSPDPVVSLNVFIAVLKGLGLPRGTQTSLTSKLESAASAAQSGDENAVSGSLNAFMNEVEALRGKKIPEATADGLLQITATLLGPLPAGSTTVLPFKLTP